MYLSVGLPHFDQTPEGSLRKMSNYHHQYLKNQRYHLYLMNLKYQMYQGLHPHHLYLMNLKYRLFLMNLMFLMNLKFHLYQMNQMSR